MSILAFPSTSSAEQKGRSSFADPRPDDSGCASKHSPEPSGTGLPDALERMRALDTSQSWLVEAPAGSGKTGLLIQRYLKLLAMVDQPESVLALTFTNKATAEMRDRVLQALEGAAREADPQWAPFERLTWQIAQDVLRHDAARGWDLRSQAHRLNIRTIDSLCGEIARAVPVLSGGLGGATPVRDMAAVALYREAARAVLLHLGGSDAGLNAAIETVLLQRDGDLLECEQLLAEMLQTREQWGALVPLSLETLEDAALETEVLPRLNAALQTLICGALTSLRDRFPEDLLQDLSHFGRRVATLSGYRENPNPLGHCEHLHGVPGVLADDRMHWDALSNLLITKDGTLRKSFNVNQVGIDLTRPLKAELKDLINRLHHHDEELPAVLCALRELPPSSYPPEQWRVAKALFRLLHRALIELRFLFAERELCDFTELSMAARAALREEDGANRVATALGIRLDHLLVDEMQDTSTGQYELLEALTAGWNGRDQTVFLVGDPKQSIYLFRQARVERFMEGLRTGRLGGIELGILQLSANFRSGTELVHSFNETFAEVFSAKPGGISYSAASPVLPPGGSLSIGWNVEVVPANLGAEDDGLERQRLDREEAETIAKTARDWRHRPLPAGRLQPWKIAVLVRARAHARQVMRKLKEAAVPFHAVEMDELGERPEVLDAVALTRALLHPADRVAWLAVLRAPWCGLSLRELHILAGGDDTAGKRSALRVLFRERATTLPLDSRQRLLRTLDVMDAAAENRGRTTIAVAVEQAWASLGGDASIDTLGRTNIRRYLELLAQIEGEGARLDAALLRARVRKLYAEPASAPDAVDVMTIHKAKGLEWDLVFLPGLQKKGGQETTRLLDWMELPARDADGHAQVLLAPVQERGDEKTSLNRYISRVRSQQVRAELKRLFYVATTRARSSVQLFAAPEQKANGDTSVGEDTLLGAAWPAIQKHFAATDQQGQRSIAPVPPKLAVLPMRTAPLPSRDFEDFALAAAAEAPGGVVDDLQEQARPERSILIRLPLSVDARRQLRLRALPALPESAKPASALARLHRPEGSLRARSLGKTVHAFLEHLSRCIAVSPKPAEAWIAEVNSWSPRIRAVLRGDSLRGADVELLTVQTTRALTQTLQDPEGRWLLESHAGAVSEGEFAAWDEATETSRRSRLDRSFFASATPGSSGSGVLWIVDYKTADHSEAGREAFLQREREKYEEQLRAYAKLRMPQLPPGTKIMLALYHPLLPKLTWWQYA